MNYRNVKALGMIFLIVNMLFCNLVFAEDWITYQHDYLRSGITSEKLSTKLNEQWRYISRHAPRPSWQEPAKQDFWHNIYDIRKKVKYDEAYHIIAVGNAVYFSSSADDKIYCLEASTGNEIWSFFTEAPVRLAPSFWENKVYVGSDDGCVYCLDAKNGELIWKYHASPNQRMISGNNRMVSVWAVRTGVVVEDGIVYFGAGLFPKEKVYLCALDARDGTEIWKKVTTISPQGYILASENRLYLPTGRTAPAIFNRKNGELLGTLRSHSDGGGTYALLTAEQKMEDLEDETIISGPSNKLREFNTESHDQIATFNGRKIIISNDVSYLLSDDEISAIVRTKYFGLQKQRANISKDRNDLAAKISELRKQRKDLSSEKLNTFDREINKMVQKMEEFDKQLKDLEGSEYKWRKPLNKIYYSMILTGEDKQEHGILFIGGDQEILALRASDGKQLWQSKLSGKAYSIAVSNGRLFVGTDKGVIHCFSEDTNNKFREIQFSKEQSPYPKDSLTDIYASAAENIVKASGIQKGYCLVLGCAEGRLAYEIAKRTKLKIVAIDDNIESVENARKTLDQAGIYGIQVSVHHGSLSKLPYTDYFANLIVSDRVLISGSLPGIASEMFRVLRPFGGIIGQPEMASNVDEELSLSELEEWKKQCSKPEWKETGEGKRWAIIQRHVLPNSGEWTHQYAEPGNSACSGDSLVKENMQIQWFGAPGPRPMVDRHHRALAPLWKDGRLFVPAAGENRIIAVDAYNGTIIWDVEVPNYRRVGANRDAGNMAVTDDYLYVATEDSCWGLDVKTGEHSLSFKLPSTNSEQHHWGYLATVDNMIFGSGQKKSASLTKLSRNTIYEIYYDFRPIVISDYFFCLNRHTGKQFWHYENGVIINPAIAVGDEDIYFIESRNPDAIAENDGRIKLEMLLKSGYGYLVSLNKQTGEKNWEQQVDFPFQHIIFLSYSNGIILAWGTRNQENHPRYDFYGFNANNGDLEWKNHFISTERGIGGGHGEQEQHAVIAGNSIYLYDARSYDLQTGEKKSYKLNRGGHGCGTLSGSKFCLFGRGGNPRMYKITDTEEKGIPLTNVNRPGCWINIIPAGGLVLIPEFSSGCTCAYPIQTSIALISSSMTKLH